MKFRIFADATDLTINSVVQKYVEAFSFWHCVLTTPSMVKKFTRTILRIFYLTTILCYITGLIMEGSFSPAVVFGLACVIQAIQGFAILIYLDTGAIKKLQELGELWKEMTKLENMSKTYKFVIDRRFIGYGITLFFVIATWITTNEVWDFKGWVLVIPGDSPPPHFMPNILWESRFSVCLSVPPFCELIRMGDISFRKRSSKKKF